MTKTTEETLTVRDLRIIAAQDRICEFLGDDWGDVSDRVVVVTYPEHCRMKRLTTECSFCFA